MKILLVRFGSMGDIVLTTLLIRCLKQIESSEIHMVTKSKYEDLLRTSPHIDRLILMNRHLDELVGILKNEAYDLIIV